jgi:hypothetical protein
MSKRRIRPLTGKEAEEARERSIQEALSKKMLSPDQLRRLWARASSAKRHILKIIAPELFELRARHEALERFIIDYFMLELRAEDSALIKSKLKKMKAEYISSLPDDDLLQHLAGRSNDEVWKGVEDSMVRDIYEKQKHKLLKGIGVFEGKGGTS